MELNNIKRAVTETALNAGKKAGEVANKTKIRFALANMQSDLDELYEKLGKLYYEAISKGTENGTKESAVIAKIDSIKADMEVLKAEIGLFPRSGKVCGACGKTIPKNAEFCPYCGEKFAK